jgi:hypothetical protein
MPSQALASGQKHFKRYPIGICALPVELLTLIVAQILSRLDLVHLHLTCKTFGEVVSRHREGACLKLFATLDDRADLYGTMEWDVPAIFRVHPSPKSAILNFLVGFLPSEEEALETLYEISWTRHYSADFEAFVLETLYEYVELERFLQDIGATRRLRNLFKADHRNSSLRRLLSEETKFCLTRGSYSGVSQRASEVCKDYEDLGRRGCSLDFAQTLLDGLYRECGHSAPSTRCWAEHVQRLEGPEITNEVQICASDSLQWSNGKDP